MEEAIDPEVAVAGAGVNCAIGMGDFHLAITGLDAQVARDMIESHVAIASSQTQVALQPGESYISVRGRGLQSEFLEIPGYPEGPGCYGVVVKWPALVVVELPPINTV